MVKIKPLARIVSKWADVTPGRAPYYEEGVKSPRADWATEAAKAAKTWAEAITEAASRDAYRKGVQEAGTEKWQRKATTVGVERYGPGVRAAAPDFEKGFAPYHSVLERITLKPRGPKGSAINYERVKQIGDALHKAKIGTTTTGGGK